MTEVTVKPGAFLVEIKYNEITKNYKVIPYQYHVGKFCPSKYSTNWKPGIYHEVIVGSASTGYRTLTVKYFKKEERAKKYAQKIVDQGVEFIKSTLTQEEVRNSWTTHSTYIPDFGRDYTLTIAQWNAVNELRKKLDEEDD